MNRSRQRSIRTATRLTAAERARTIIATATTLRLVSPELTLEVHRHGVDPSGAILFGAPTDQAERLDAFGVTATAIDVATVPQADRVRGEVTLTGTVRSAVEPRPAGMRLHLTGSEEPDPSTRLVRLEPDRIALTWRCEVRSGEPAARLIEVEDYRRAFPDPLLGYEAAWLPHLQADHGALLTALARYELGWDEDPDDVRALGIDRYGVVLRVRHGATVHDLRIGFDRTVVCGCDVREAFGVLAGRAGRGDGPVC